MKQFRTGQLVETQWIFYQSKSSGSYEIPSLEHDVRVFYSEKVDSLNELFAQQTINNSTVDLFPRFPLSIKYDDCFFVIYNLTKKKAIINLGKTKHQIQNHSLNIKLNIMAVYVMCPPLNGHFKHVDFQWKGSSSTNLIVCHLRGTWDGSILRSCYTPPPFYMK